jgi:hypothetical protein
VLALAIAFPQQAGMPTVLPSTFPVPLHLEMWARSRTDGPTRYQRLTADVGNTDRPQTFPGFQVVRAVDPNDPCLIRGMDTDDERCTDGGSDPPEVCGASLFSRKAQVVTDGTTAELLQLGLVAQARKVTAQETAFNAIDPTVTGRAPTALLALVRHRSLAEELADPRSPARAMNETRAADKILPAITPSNAEDPAASQQRLRLCQEFRASSPSYVPESKLNLNLYIGNPRQYTKPLSGTLFGFFSFSTSSTVTPGLPNQSFSGITFSVPLNLTDIEELLVTLEPSYAHEVPPTAPTMTNILYQGIRQPDVNAGRGVIRLVMRLNVNPPNNSTNFINAGTAAILTNLDSSLD